VLTEAGGRGALVWSRWGWPIGPHRRARRRRAAPGRLPKVIEALRCVTAVSSGAQHSICALQDGRVFGWGFGEDETLGLQLTDHQRTPLEYPTLRVLARFWRRARRFWINPERRRGRPHRGVELCAVSHVHAEVGRTVCGLTADFRLRGTERGPSRLGLGDCEFAVLHVLQVCESE
jgi:hypothetical protein